MLSFDNLPLASASGIDSLPLFLALAEQLNWAKAEWNQHLIEYSAKAFCFFKPNPLAKASGKL